MHSATDALRLHILAGGARLDANAYLLSLAGHHVLLDAGASFKGDRHLVGLPALDAVLLTHAHADHIGGVPALLEANPRTPCYATAATRSLVPFALAPRLPGETAQIRAEAIRDLFHVLPMNQTSRILSSEEMSCSIDVTPWRAGHVFGAASMLLDISIGAKFHRVYYTSDFCLHDQPLTPGAQLPDLPIDTLIMEGVLAGFAPLDDYDASRAWLEFCDAIASHAGPRLLPCAAIGEAPEVAHALLSHGVPLTVHELSRPVLERYSRAHGVSWEGLTYADLVACRAALDAGEVVLATGAHLEKGSPSYLLARHILGRKRALIALLNNIRHSSPAGALWRTKPDDLVMWAAQPLLRAHVASFLLPNHAPGPDLIGAVESLTPKRVILVHGRKKGLDRLARKLRKIDGVERVEVPADSDTLTLLDPAHIHSA